MFTLPGSNPECSKYNFFWTNTNMNTIWNANSKQMQIWILLFVIYLTANTIMNSMREEYSQICLNIRIFATLWRWVHLAPQSVQIFIKQKKPIWNISLCFQIFTNSHWQCCLKMSHTQDMVMTTPAISLESFKGEVYFMQY